MNRTNQQDLFAQLESTLADAVRACQAHGGSLFAYNPETRAANFLLSAPLLLDKNGEMHPYGMNAALTAARTGRPSILDNYTNLEDRVDPVNEPHPIVGLLSVPVLWQGQTAGVINLFHTEPHRCFTQRDLERVTGLAKQSAIIFVNARLVEEARQRAEEAQTLRQATQAVIGALNLTDALERILVQLERVVPYDSASVQMLKDGYLEIVGGRGWDDPQAILGMRFPVPGENPNTLVVQEQRPHILGNAPQANALFQEKPHVHIVSWLGVPLVVQGQTTGMLAVDSRQPDFYHAHHARLASAFADHVAIAIQNARLYTAEQRRAEELEALRATMADISAELELPKLLQSILIRAINMTSATGGDLGLYDEARQEIEIVASYNMGKDYTGTRQMLGEGALGYVAQTGRSALIDEYNQWEHLSEQYRDGAWHSVLAVPFMIGERLVGAIGIVDLDPQRHFQASNERQLNLFAQQAAIAVENARLYQTARQAAERRAILHEASQEIVTVRMDPEGVYIAIHHAAAQLMPAEAFVITLYNEARQVVEAVYLVDQGERIQGADIPFGQGLCSTVIAEGKTIYIEDNDAEEEDSDSVYFGTDETVHSILATPMRLGNRVIGMLSVQSYQTNAYSSEDQYLLEMLASYAAIALDNARLLAEVQRLAITDPLTEIFNRRQLFELGQREFSRARRFGRPLSALMVDIDLFKDVNDTCGHAAGDQVLQELARRLQSELREVDILGRYGGEEFLIILLETDLEAAVQAAGRLRLHAAQPMMVADGMEVEITVSVGAAAIQDSTRDLAALITCADAALYDAKRAGRNRVASR